MGPYELDQVRFYYSQGSLLPKDFAYHDGLAGWIPLQQLMAELPAVVVEAPVQAQMPQDVAHHQPEASSSGDAVALSKVKKKTQLMVAVIAGVLVLGGLAFGGWMLIKDPEPAQTAQNQTSSKSKQKTNPEQQSPSIAPTNGDIPKLPSASEVSASPAPPPVAPGTILWKTKEEGAFGGFAIGQNGVVYCSYSNKAGEFMLALDGETGDKIWEYNTGRARISCAPGVDRDNTVIFAVNNRSQKSYKIIALDGKAGNKKWEFQVVNEVRDTPLIGRDGTILVGAAGIRNSKEYILNSKTGALIEERPIKTNIYVPSAVDANGVIYRYINGSVESVNPSDGSLIWRTVEREYGFGNGIIVGPNNTIIPGMRPGWPSGVMGISSKTGKKVFQVSLGRRVRLSAPVTGLGAMIYMGDTDGILNAVDTSNGKVKWTFKTSKSLADTCPAVGGEGTVYLLSAGDKTVYALKGDNGELLWQKTIEEALYKWQYPILSDKGVLFLAAKHLIAIKTDSEKAASSPWPMRGACAQNTGISGGASEKNMPGPSFLFAIKPALETLYSDRGFVEKIMNKDPEAIHELAFHYFHGKGIYPGSMVEKDVDQGLKYLEESLKLGSSRARRDLGLIYFTGENGIKKNFPRAYAMWKDVNSGSKALEHYKKEMTPEQINEGEKIYRELQGSSDEMEGWVSDPSDPNNVKIERWIRDHLKKPTDELTKADLEKVTGMNLRYARLTEIPKELEKLTQLRRLFLNDNNLTEVPKGLEKLTQLTYLDLEYNPNLTKAQIAELQKALPKCKISSNPKK
jgi:outer membrane protein assembly factor BamB